MNNVLIRMLIINLMLELVILIGGYQYIGWQEAQAVRMDAIANRIEQSIKTGAETHKEVTKLEDMVLDIQPENDR